MRALGTACKHADTFSLNCVTVAAGWTDGVVAKTTTSSSQVLKEKLLDSESGPLSSRTQVLSTFDLSLGRHAGFTQSNGYSDAPVFMKSVSQAQSRMELCLRDQARSKSLHHGGSRSRLELQQPCHHPQQKYLLQNLHPHLELQPLLGQEPRQMASS